MPTFADSAAKTATIALRAARNAAPSLAEIIAPGSTQLVETARKLVKAAAPVVRDASAAPLAWVGSWYAYAAASDPDEVPYDLSFWRAGLSVVGASLGAWLSAKRSEHALPVMAGTAALSAVLGALQYVKDGEYATRSWPEDGTREQLFNRALPLVQAALAATSVVNTALARPTRIHELAVAPVPAKFRALWPYARRLGLYYMVFAFLGHWGEMLFCTGIKYGLIRGGYDRENHMLWDQWLFPFPAEGVAAVLAAAFLLPARNAVHNAFTGFSKNGLLHELLVLPLAVTSTFLMNQLVCTSIDYMTGMVANRNYELWDYRDMPFNFQGQICLQNSLVYSAVATWAVWRLVPRIDALMAAAPEQVLDGVFVGLGSFFVFLELLYHVVPKDVAQMRDALMGLLSADAAEASEPSVVAESPETANASQQTETSQQSDAEQQSEAEKPNVSAGVGVPIKSQTIEPEA